MDVPAAFRLEGDGPDLGEQLRLGAQDVQQRRGVGGCLDAGHDSQMAEGGRVGAGDDVAILVDDTVPGLGLQKRHRHALGQKQPDGRRHPLFDGDLANPANGG